MPLSRPPRERCSPLMPIEWSTGSHLSSYCIPAHSSSGLVSICLVTSFSRAGRRVVHFPDPHSIWHKVGAHRCLVNLINFACHLLLLFLKVYLHNILPEDSACHPREDVKHVACGVAVAQVFTCESLNVGGSARKQKSLSQQDIYQMDCPLMRFPLKHHSPLSRRHFSANHTQVCWGDGCASNVTIQQYDTD